MASPWATETVAGLRRIIVIGGGFCGAAFAIHCARQAQDLSGAAEIIIVEPRAELGQGLAYGSEDPVHRVNVPAALMTMFPEEPLHFEAWLQRSGARDADPGMP